MDCRIYYGIISLFLISSISFNFTVSTTDKTFSSEKDNRPDKLSSEQEIYENKTNIIFHRRYRLTVQNFMLIWLDSNIDDSDDKYHNSIVRLREIVNTIYTFTDANQCVDFLNKIKYEKIFLILSDDLVQSTISLIHGMSQLDSIYIFSRNKSKYEQSTTQWTKIKGIFTQIDSIIHILKEDAQQCDRNSLSFSVTSAHFDHLDSGFLYTCLLQKTLIEIKHDDNAKKELADFSREQYRNNSYELQKIDAFERDYRLDTAIWWYAQKCFLYQMLSRALRTQEFEVIMKIGFFLRDVHRQIEELHSQKTRSTSLFFVYRGQAIFNTDLEKIKRTNKGDMLVFQNLLSVSLNKKTALEFARNSLYNPDLVGILFNITINTSASSNPFVSRRQIDAFANEKEGILFSIHTVFRITDIMPIENRLWQVDLTLVRDDDQQLKQLHERMRKEITKSTPWQRLGSLLIRMRNFDKAEEVYQILVHTTLNADEKSLPHLYNQLGRIKDKKKDYMEALEFFRKALEIQQKSLPSNHPTFVTTYNNFGLVYNNMKMYSKALDFYRKTLEIQQDFLPSNHQNLVTTYNNIGLVHRNLEEYSNALGFYQKVLEIQQKSLPSDHQDFTTTYNNIASIHRNMKEYSKALSFYEKALKIYTKSFPSDHPYLATTNQNIGFVHKNMGQYSKALKYFQKALEIREKSLPSDHPDMAIIYSNMGSLYIKMKQYSNAIQFCQKAFEIQQETLSKDDLSLAVTFHDIASAHYNMGEYPKALEFFNKTLEIRRKNLPANHADMAAIYYDIGLVYHSMKEDSIALSFFERAVEIGQVSLSENNSDLALYRKNLYELKHEL